MSDENNYRWQRIERLFEELKYELTRGMLEGEIDESVGFRFIVPVSKAVPGGVVFCEFRSRPIPAHGVPFDGFSAPKLRVVK